MNTLFFFIVMHTESTNLDRDFQMHLSKLHTKFLGKAYVLLFHWNSYVIIHSQPHSCLQHKLKRYILLRTPTGCPVSMRHTSHPTSSCYTFDSPHSAICSLNTSAPHLISPFVRLLTSGWKRRECMVVRCLSFCPYQITVYVIVQYKIYPTQCLPHQHLSCVLKGA